MVGLLLGIVGLYLLPLSIWYCRTRPRYRYKVDILIVDSSDIPDMTC